MKHFFITNREILNNNGQESIRPDGKERAGDNLRFGTYDMAHKKFDIFPEPATEADLVYRSIDANTDPGTLVGSGRFFKAVYDAMKSEDPNGPEGDTLVFIHGFNTNLKSVEEAFEHLNNQYVLPNDNPIKHIIIITWPGQTNALPLHYRNDAEDARRSGLAFARGFEKLIDFFRQFLGREHEGNPACGRKIHLMAHSMGNRVLKHIVLDMLEQRKNLPEIFETISLVAADVEYDIFEKDGGFAQLIDMANRISIYYHQGDNVLDVSKYTKNFSNRLGRYGRKRKDQGIAEIKDFDCTKYEVDMGDALERKGDHWYYYASTEAINQIKKNFTIS
jgi:esterase/lipase superfamily enzyme